MIRERMNMCPIIVWRSKTGLWFSQKKLEEMTLKFKHKDTLFTYWRNAVKYKKMPSDARGNEFPYKMKWTKQYSQRKSSERKLRNICVEVLSLVVQNRLVFKWLLYNELGLKFHSKIEISTISVFLLAKLLPNDFIKRLV